MVLFLVNDYKTPWNSMYIILYVCWWVEQHQCWIRMWFDAVFPYIKLLRLFFVIGIPVLVSPVGTHSFHVPLMSVQNSHILSIAIHLLHKKKFMAIGNREIYLSGSSNQMVLNPFHLMAATATLLLYFLHHMSYCWVHLDPV